MSSTMMIIILQWFKPLDSNWAIWVETVNEYTTFVLLILMMCMSDFVPDLFVKHDIGTVYITVICLFGLFHLIPIIYKAIRQLRLVMKRLFNRAKCCKKRQLESLSADKNAKTYKVPGSL